MNGRDTLATLKDRVDAADGPNYDLERDIHRSLVRVPVARIPACTASTDAATELVELLLSTYSIKMSIDPSGCGCELTWWPDGLTGSRSWSINEASEDLCLAIISALLAVLIAEIDSQQGE